MRHSKIESTITKTARVLVGVFIVATLVVGLGLLSKFSAYATVERLEIQNISTEGSWEFKEIENANDGDQLGAITPAPDDLLQVDFVSRELCDSDISAFIVSGNVRVEDLNDSIDLSINNEAHRNVEFNDDANEKDFRFLINTKDSGLAWDCTDTENIYIQVRSISHELTDQQSEQISWEINSLKLEIEYQLRKPDLKQTNFSWNTLADDNNITATNLAPMPFEKGMKVILYTEIANQTTIPSNNDQYSLQFAESESGFCSDSLEWISITKGTDITSWLSETRNSEERFIDNTCEGANCSEVVVGDNNDYGKFYTIPEKSVLQLGFPIDLINVKSGVDYCFRTVKRSAEETDYQPLATYEHYPLIRVPQEPEIKFLKNLEKNEKGYLKSPKKTVSGGGYATFNLQVFDSLKNGEIYFEDVIESSRTLDIEEYNFTAILLDPEGIEVDTHIELTLLPTGELIVRVQNLKQFKPGLFTLVVNTKNSGNKIDEITHQFAWGVSAINTDKDLYEPGDEVSIMMTVLDDEGKTVCDAEIDLEIENPTGEISRSSTRDETVDKSEDCGPNNFTYTPDFSDRYSNTSDEGEYLLRMTATTDNGTRTTEQTFKVDDDRRFSIYRESATRIYPLRVYDMKITIEAFEDYKGPVREILPKSFKIIETDGAVLNKTESKEIIWDVDMKAGEIVFIGYSYDAPDIAPEFYVTGPLQIDKYQELRTWQIASDAVTSKYSVTCTGWTNNAGGQGAPTLADTAGYSSFNTTNSAYSTVSAQNTMDCSGFNSTSLGTFNSAQVMVSLAADGAAGDNDDTTIEYDVNGGGFNTLATITHNSQKSNSTNGGYWTYTAGNITTWADIANTTVRFTNSKNQGPDNNPIYIDAVWIEVDYTPNTITMSGTCKEFNQTTDCDSSETVRFAINNTLQAQTGTVSTGNWTITGVSQPQTGDVITVYLSGQTDSNEANNVHKYDGTGNITGVPLIKEHLVIGSDDNQTLNNSEIGTYDNGVSGNEDIFFEVDGSNNLNVDGVSQSTQEELFIDASNIYQPSSVATVTTTTHDLENTGTLTLDGNTLKLSGSWFNSSTFNANTGTVILNATSGSENLNSTGGTGAFNNLTFGEISGSASWSLSSTLDVNGNMDIDYGTLLMGSQPINLAGNLTIESGGDYTKGTSNFTFDGGATQTWTDNNTTKIDLGSVRLGGAGHTLQLGSSATLTDIIVPTGYTFDLTSNGYTFTVLGSGSGTSRPFYINGGTFTSGTNSTFIYNSTSALDVQSTTYDTLQLKGSSGTYTLGSGASETITTNNFTIGDGTGTFTTTAETYDPTINVNGNFTIQSNATFSASSTSTFNVGANWSNSGTFTDNTGRVTFNSTSTGRTISGSLSGSSQFYNVTFNGSGGGWTIQDPMTVSGDTTSSLNITQGNVTVGNGDGDDLTALGQIVVGSASGTAILQTASGLSQGSEIEININSPTPVSCTNCNVIVGTSTDGDPAGTMIINKNGVLRFNSETSVESGIEVRASGNFQVNGSSDDTGSSTSGTNDVILYDSGKSWSANQHQGKYLLITSGYAEGEVISIDSNITTSLSFTDEFSSTDTGGSYTSGTHTFTTSVSLISANDEGVGQYLFNSTQGKYSRIVNTTENSATDSIVIVDYPDTFTYTSGDNVTISTGIQSGDTYSIIDYAYVTGGAGTSCDADEVSEFHGFVNSLQNSETTLNYANVCDLGANVASKYGISFTNISEGDTNETATITNSYLHHNYDSIYMSGVGGVNINSNSIQQSTNGIYVTGSSGNRITGNLISESSSNGLIIANSGSKNNRIDNNHFYGSGTNIAVQTSSINRFEANEIAGGTYGIHLSSSADENFIFENIIYGSTSYGLYFQSTSNHLLFDNQIFGSSSGLYVSGSTNNLAQSDQYGVTQENTYDINYDSGSTSNFSCYGCDMGSTNEYNGLTATGSYLISEDHDPTSQSGLTMIVGEYTVPNDLVETVSFDEGTQQFNYADELWTDASSPAMFAGGGTEDTDIQITLTSNITSTEIYLAVVTTVNADTPTFTITRTNGTATPSTYTLPGTYTETGTGVQFTIQDGATNYTLGDVYAFLVGPGSDDTNTQKITQVMQSGDILSVASGETIELLGIATLSEIQGPTGGFQFDVGGTINADSYKITGTDSSGLNISSTATVTELQNGVFDDSEGATGADTYITVDPAVLNNGADTFSSITFDESTSTDTNAEYNVTLSTDPSACTNSWTFENSPGLKATESFDNDNGDGGPCNGGEGYILFASSTNNSPNPPSNLQQKTTGDVVIIEADWINSTSVKFTASASDPDLSDTLQLCIEIDLLGTTFSGTADSCGTGVAYSGTAVDVEHTITGLTDGSQYHWQAQIQDANTNTSTWVSFGTNTEAERDIGIDTSNPSTVTVYDGETYLTDADENDGSLDHLFGSWTDSTDAQSGIKEYQYAIGTTSGGTDVVNWTSNSNAGGLFGDGFESGDFTAWDANSTGGGDLVATITEPNTGLYSMSTTINDTGAIFVQDDFSSSSEYYGRFYLNMNNYTPGNGSSTNIFTISDGSTARANIQFGRTGGTVWIRAEETVGASTTANVTLPTTGWVSVEIHWVAGSSVPVTLWVDGTSYTTTNANTSGLTLNKAQLGYTGGTNINNTIYLDDYSSDTQYRQGPMGYLSADIVSANHLRTGESYYISVRAVNNAEGISTPGNSDGQSVLPTFSFSLSTSSINLLNLNFGNSWTSTDTVQTTASTNAYNGYVARIKTTQNLTNTIDGNYTIPMYSGTNTLPTNWTGIGFGYTTADGDLSGGTGNRFTSAGPNYAGFTTSGPGDPVADHTDAISGTTGALINQQFTITLRVTANESQAAGPYTTDIIFIATPNF